VAEASSVFAAIAEIPRPLLIIALYFRMPSRKPRLNDPHFLEVAMWKSDQCGAIEVWK
jgi:hypothetical protein